jgi:hypothetical protein
MKLLITLSLACFSSALFAQTTVTVTTGPSNSQQTWYSLQNGVVESRDLAEWDLAFEITGITGSILANTAKGILVYKTPFTLAQWAAVDTAGLSTSWPAQHNSETNWSAGAFNRRLNSNPFYLGWGTYNMSTHNILGDTVFVVKLADGAFKKFRVDNYLSATNTFTFTWSNLDGSNEQSNTLNRSTYAGRNFGYVSLVNNTVFDREPANSTWDLLFTKYMAFVPFPTPSMYPVAGVLQNAGTEAQRVNGVDYTFSDWSAAPFSTEIDQIGYDWKSFNQQTFQWEYATDRVHFVRDQAGNVWKLVFTTYGGSANGNMTFTQELMSATSVEENLANVGFTVYPNPTNNGQVQLVIDGPESTMDLSIVDMAGRIVLQQRLNGLVDLNAHPVDVSSLATGLYTMRLQGSTTSGSTRLLVD